MDLTLSNTIPVDGRRHFVESITSWGPNPPLKYLQLKNCKVPSEVSCDLFMCLAACIDLADLNLIGNTVGEEGYYLAESIRSWGRNTSLKKLLLCNCKIPGDVCADLVKSLTFCRHLNHLDLSGNHLASAGTHLAEVFRSWTPGLSVATRKRLENILLRKHSKPPGDQDISLAQSKRRIVRPVESKNPGLQSLHLRDCKMNEDVDSQLLECLANLRQLLHLDLTGNTLGAEGRHLVEAIEAWGEDPPLKTLQLNDCKIPEDVCSSIVKSLHTCKNITFLDLSGNSLGDEAQRLQEFIVNVGSKLQRLQLSNCRIPEHICGKILKSLATCQDLSFLDLSGDTVGAAGYHLSQSVRTWGLETPLQGLLLRGCQIPENVYGEILRSISSCKDLTYLDLSSNTVGGSTHHLVESIKEMGPNPPLQGLWLRNCKITEGVCGRLLKTLTSCRNLIHLDLSGNILGIAGSHLIDSIRSWGDDAPLQILGLDKCQMPQEVSASLLSVLSTCKCLEFLSPPGNTLTGCLSNYIPQPILRELDISNAGLNKGDLLYLINLVENNKVPQLQKLWLVRNDLQEMTHLLERLVEAFVTHHQRQLVLLLFKINVR